MIRRPPRSTPLYSSAASDVYKRQVPWGLALFDDALYAGTLDAFNAVTGARQSWTYPVSPDRWGVSIRAIASLDDSLIVAGNFNSVSGPPLANLAVLPRSRSLRFSAQLTSNGAARVQVSSQSGIQSVLQSTTNLLDWTSIVTNSGSFLYDDTNATKFPAIFYRGLKQP